MRNLRLRILDIKIFTQVVSTSTKNTNDSYVFMLNINHKRKLTFQHDTNVYGNTKYCNLIFFKNVFQMSHIFLNLKDAALNEALFLKA